MNKLPKKCVIDTNVPATANKTLSPETISDDMIDCVETCLEAITHITKNGRLVLDEGDEIFNEYRAHLSLSGQPGLGDEFMKWVHDNCWTEKVERVKITKTGNSYKEFPTNSNLSGFDPSDKKFIAIANAHPEKPPILQATDSKWWGYCDALKNVEIEVQFLCCDYIKKKHKKKMKN